VRDQNTNGRLIRMMMTLMMMNVGNYGFVTTQEVHVFLQHVAHDDP
jgi:hypothetical protein